MFPRCGTEAVWLAVSRLTALRLGVGRYGESVPLLLIWPELTKENRALCGQERCLLGACPDCVARPWVAARAGIRHTPQNTSPRGSKHPVASPIHPGKDTAQGRRWIEPQFYPPSRYTVNRAAWKCCDQEVRPDSRRCKLAGSLAPAGTTSPLPKWISRSSHT
jgi:hypothetical protein